MNTGEGFQHAVWTGALPEMAFSDPFTLDLKAAY